MPAAISWLQDGRAVRVKDLARSANQILRIERADEAIWSSANPFFSPAGYLRACAVTEELAGSCTRALALIKRYLTINQNPAIAISLLYAPPLVAG
jgi:hypothetical protein